MERLLTLDLKDYTDDMPVFEKHTVRAIIMRDGRLSMQLSGRGEYKIPGGGVEGDESHVVALQREVREETGLIILPESVREIGEILELREDVFCKGTKYICHSYFYFCDVEDRTVETQMTDSEIAKGFHPIWEYPEVICRVNDAIQTEPWQKRDTEFVRMLLDGRIRQDT
ncbi:MAG: NUDIX domain-containing protein [Clostridia bacterium]|nr:NUDIX domain-containing protein [Clostridia bacterium]